MEPILKRIHDPKQGDLLIAPNRETLRVDTKGDFITAEGTVGITSQTFKILNLEKFLYRII